MFLSTWTRTCSHTRTCKKYLNVYVNVFVHCIWENSCTFNWKQKCLRTMKKDLKVFFLICNSFWAYNIWVVPIGSCNFCKWSAAEIIYYYICIEMSSYFRHDVFCIFEGRILGNGHTQPFPLNTWVAVEAYAQQRGILRSLGSPGLDSLGLIAAVTLVVIRLLSFPSLPPFHFHVFKSFIFYGDFFLQYRFAKAMSRFVTTISN